VSNIISNAINEAAKPISPVDGEFSQEEEVRWVNGYHGSFMEELISATLLLLAVYLDHEPPMIGLKA